MDQLDLQEFMARVQGKPGAEVMNMMLLRSMQQARYSGTQSWTLWTCGSVLYPTLLVQLSLPRPLGSPNDS